MRKFIIAALAATVIVPAAASAQSYGEVRQGQREVRQDRRQLDRAVARGDRGDIRDARQELREDRRELREDRRDFRQDRRGNYRDDRGGYAYRGGAYRGPQGYRYRPVAVGYRFAPSYYGRNYWVNDYANYQLARPRFGYQRWIRYGRDVVLVDTRSGRVVQVRNRFFR
ncbi:RcnB family protein [Sphingomonas sp.]|jgi:Ni/Co efflux regulator RcnB|uniref:RcnB family protein n=1 Tax=Sphingomonas sp. TaxID=28214 RepID=UPI002EDAB1EC